jgi:4a-hydroxytetrahydrobiopterin dehydratase
MTLADRPIQPLPKGSPALSTEACAALLGQLAPGWTIAGARLEHRFAFDDFAAALRFVVTVGAMADAVDHHPEITLAWGAATIAIWTHTVGGLAEIDFIFAARADALYAALEPIRAYRIRNPAQPG